METKFETFTYSSGTDRFPLLLDARFSADVRYDFERRLEEVSPEGGGVWVASSGTTQRAGSGYTFLALTESALRVSARAVNHHLRANAGDVFVSCLPDFHVGGLGLQVRARELGARFVRSAGNDRAWSVAEFARDIEANGGTIVSLVPTQVVDLIRAGLHAPSSVRVAVVGGGALSWSEYERGRALGWPLLPSYGCTECSSQIATASLSSLDSSVGEVVPPLELLAHVEAREEGGVLSIKSAALFSCRVSISGEAVAVEVHQTGDWYKTSDLAELHGRTVKPCGRVDDLIKIGGQGVNLHELSLLVRDIREGVKVAGDVGLSALPDERLGQVLILRATDRGLGEAVREMFNKQVLPFARIRSVEIVTALERTALGKLKRG